MSDLAFCSIVLNGKPESRLPLPAQISCNIKTIVEAAEEHVGKTLKVCEQSTESMTHADALTRASRAVFI